MVINQFTVLSQSEFSKGNYETAFSLACQALDTASKIIYPNKKSGERFKKIIDDNFDFFCSRGLPGISCKGIIFSNSMIKNELELKNDTATLQEIIYKLIRCSLIHECALPERIKLTGETLVGPKENVFYMPVSIVSGLLALVEKITK
jgi:hypothetical protein